MRAPTDVDEANEARTVEAGIEAETAGEALPVVNASPIDDCKAGRLLELLSTLGVASAPISDPSWSTNTALPSLMRFTMSSSSRGSSSSFP